MTEPTRGAKMMYLIKRRPNTSREELIAHWFANHMPIVIDGQLQQKESGGLHAWRYIATLFDADKTGTHAWDGVAQLWWDRALPMPDTPFGTEPTDTFQQKAEPYVPWATTEYVIMDDAEQLSSAPLTLNAPYPMTRSGFYKVTFLVGTKADTDHAALYEHWLGVHVPNVRGVMEAVGGYRYVVSHSINPADEPYAGMAELYFTSQDGWRAYLNEITADGMEQWVSDEKTTVLKAHTEMVGIP